MDGDAAVCDNLMVFPLKSGVPTMPFLSSIDSTFRRTTWLVPVLLSVLAQTAAAQPLPDVVETEVSPGRREIERLILEIQEHVAAEPSRAAESFELAWNMAIRREDPLIYLKTKEQQQLLPGQHQVDAGSRSRLQRLFESLSPEFRKAYQERVVQSAETDLQDAMDSGSMNDLTTAILRYQFTKAGQQALERLIRLRLSRGEYLPAALQYGRLMRLQGENSPDRLMQLALLWWNAGLPEEAAHFVREVVRTHAGQRITVNGKTILIPDQTTDVRNWLSVQGKDDMAIAAHEAASTWLQPLGNYRRTQLQSDAPAVPESKWATSSFHCAWNTELEALLAPAVKQIRRLAAYELSQNSAVIPAAVPVVVGDVLIFRGVTGIRAVHRDSGELMWESSYVDAELEGALESARRIVGDGFSHLETIQGNLVPALMNHLVRANCAGQLTCHGRVVFAVEEVTAETMRIDVDQKIAGTQRAVNYLRAYDLHTGQALGFLGGSVGLSSDDAAPNPLMGYYVLGAPLVLGERIYVMAEKDQGIFLLQLESRQLDQITRPFSLRPVHTQLLSVPRYSLRQHPVRMYSGVIPSYGRGLLICNTCDEKIIAVSAEDHAVRWVYRYPSSVSTHELNRETPVLGNAFSRARLRPY